VENPVENSIGSCGELKADERGPPVGKVWGTKTGLMGMSLWRTHHVGTISEGG
jgi:hypothetical protein